MTRTPANGSQRVVLPSMAGSGVPRLGFGRACSAVVCGMFLLTALALAAPPDWTRAPPLTAEPEVLLAAVKLLEIEGDVTRVFDSATVDVLPGGLAVSRYHMVYAVHTRAGADDVGVISAHWSPWYEDRPEVVARVLTTDGVVHTLDPAHVTEVTSDTGETLDDDRVLRAPLPAVAPGAIIEQYVTIRRHTPFFSAGEVWQFPARPWWETEHRRVSARIANGVDIVWQTADGFSDHKEPGFRVWEAENFDDKGVAETWEPDRPPEDRVPAAWLSTARDWQTVARAYRPLVDAALAGVDLSERAAKARGDATDRRVILERLAASLDEIRYLAVELGATGITPRSPEIALRNRYGDCKDKAVLLVGLLRASGIPANVALLDTGPGPHVAQAAGIDGFDHMIVFVPGPEPQWIDPTSEVTPVGRLPFMDQGRYALVIDDATRELSRTPVERSDASTFQLAWDVSIDDTSATAKIVRTDTGWLGDDARYGHRDVAPADMDKFYAEKVGDWLGGTLDGAVAVDVENDAGFSARMAVKDLTRVAREGSTITFSYAGNEVLEYLPTWLTKVADPEKGPRRGGVALAPHQARVDLRIPIPAGHVVGAMPADFERRYGSVVWTGRGTVTDSVVSLSLVFDAGSGNLTAEEAEKLRSAVVAFQKEPLDVIRFDDAALAAIQNGHIAEGLRIARERSLRPEATAADVVTYAELLLAHHFRDAAVAAVDRRLAVEPKSSVLWSFRGWAMLHDVRGNLGEVGLNLPRAAVDLQRAVALDPKSHLAWTRLALAFERRDDGTFDISNPDFPAAITAHLTSWKIEPNPDLANAIAMQLVLFGRLDEADQVLVGAPAETAATMSRVIALLRGVPPPDGTPADARRDAYEVAGVAKMLAGDLTGAADFLETSAAAGNRASESARTVRALRMPPLGEVDRADPASVALRFSHDTIALGSVEALERWGAKAMRAERKGLPPEDPVHFEVFNVVPPPAIGAHIYSGLVTCTARETEPEVGAHVICEGSSAFSIWLVPERGGWAVRALAKFPAVPTEALARLKAGDPGGSRWLSWAEPAGDKGLFEAFVANDPISAAAILAANSRNAKEVFSLLTERRDGIAEERRVDVDRALAYMALELDDDEAAAAAARRVLAVTPGDGGVSAKFLAIAQAERSPVLAAIVGEADTVGTGPARQAELLGDFTGSAEAYSKLLEAPSPSALLLNNAAWVMLADPALRPRALELAQRSCEKSGFSKVNEVHTLAMALAISGRPDEAWSLAEAKRSEQSEPWDWIYAAIADAWGIPEMADALLAARPPLAQPTHVTSGYLVSVARAKP